MPGAGGGRPAELPAENVEISAIRGGAPGVRRARGLRGKAARILAGPEPRGKSGSGAADPDALHPPAYPRKDRKPMAMLEGLSRYWRRIALILSVFVLFFLMATGLVELRFDIGTGIALHHHLLDEILAEGRLPAVLRSADFLVFAAIGLALGIALPCLPPLHACLTTFLAAAVPFACALYSPAFGRQIPFEYTLLMILVLFVVNVLVSWFAEARAKQTIVAVFGQYVPPQVVASLSDRSATMSLEGEARELSVFFSDIKNFSAISEHLEPRELARMLNTYFTLMTDILYRYDATIDKYIGDAIMAFWGAPLPQPDHARRALLAALDMQNALVDMRRDFVARGWPEIYVGIGINTGVMNVGNMGSRFRIAYTVVGDAVNLGARIEHLTRGYEADIIVSGSTRAEIQDFAFRELDYVRVKGKFQPTRIYEPICPLAKVDAALQAELDLHHRGLAAYYRREWAAARAAFEQLRSGGRFAGTYYDMLLDRIARYEREPPPVDWDGVAVYE